jgi:hypothetical protein
MKSPEFIRSALAESRSGQIARFICQNARVVVGLLTVMWQFSEIYMRIMFAVLFTNKRQLGVTSQHGVRMGIVMIWSNVLISSPCPSAAAGQPDLRIADEKTLPFLQAPHWIFCSKVAEISHF